MANKIKEIKSFISGIISSFSSSDIKDDAASYSQNIDSVNKDGVLKGIKKNDKILDDLNINTDNSVILENDDNKFDVVYTDKNTGQVKVIEDFYGNKNPVEPINASEVGAPCKTMEVHNNKVFLGYGRNLPPKVLYKTKNNPFNENSQNYSQYIFENSNLNNKIIDSSFTVDRFIGVNKSDDSTFKSAIGVRYDHKNLYYIHTNGTFTAEKVFDLSADPGMYVTLGSNSNGRNALQGAACDICEADVYQNYFTTGGHDTKFWVLCNTNSDSEATGVTPVLQKFRLTEFPSAGTQNGDVTLSAGGDTISHASEGTYQIEFQNDSLGNDTSPPLGAAPASILETRNFLWLQYWKPNGDKFGRKENFLFCADISVNSTDVSGNVIKFHNKSLNYDLIEDKQQKFRLGWLTLKTLKEYHFYNSDMPWHHMDTKQDWLASRQDWDDKIDEAGNHKYSGIFFQKDDDDNYESGFLIHRHGLINSPLADEKNYLINNNLDDLTGDNDYVGVLAQANGGMVNIFSALQHKVRGNWRTSAYWKLRPADDDGDGSNIENGGNWFEELIQNILGFLGSILILLIGTVGAILTLFDGNGGPIDRGYRKFMFMLIYGPESSNFYYNGKCFETGMINNCLINISSNHNPEAKLNSTDGANVHIRELAHFPANLDIHCARYFFGRIMITGTDNSSESDIPQTKFFMYDTTSSSIANQNLSKIGVFDPDEIIELGASELTAEHIAIFREMKTPDSYISVGTIENPLPNKILQYYEPVCDINVANYDYYDYLSTTGSTQQIYPFTEDAWWQSDDTNIPINYDTITTYSTTGDLYNISKGVFNIMKSTYTWDGQCETSNQFYLNIGNSEQSTGSIGEHLLFASTSHRLNFAKFNFLLISSDTSTVTANNYSSQNNYPTAAEEIFSVPSTNNSGVSILKLNTEPTTDSSINIKQYTLSAKEISFTAKAHAYVGTDLFQVPFKYSDEIGKELYRYKINLVYDGHQDSPISNFYQEINISDTNVRYAVESDGNYEASAISITINLHKPEYFSKRITHIRLWKSIVPLGDAGPGDDEYFSVPSSYTLVDTIELKNNWNVTDEGVTGYNNASVDLGLIASYTCVDTGKIGPSYEAYTGLPEDIRISQPNYTLSTELNGFLYIANCKHPSFEDASNLVFRSQLDKFNMFDWTRDFVSIPSTPKAITSFNGRVIVWDFNNMYLINPNNLYIEDFFEGTGCLGKNAFARTETGICFADEENIYIYDGRQISQIGIPIVKSNIYGKSISWSDRDSDYPTIVKYEPERRSFCIFFKSVSSDDLNWLQRAAKLQTNNNRWFELNGADTNFLTSEEPYEYIWHEGMWREYFQNNNDGPPEDITDDFYNDYTHLPTGIVLPYGTGYNVQTGRYVVDFNNYFATINYELSNVIDNNDALFYLLSGDFPNQGDIFDIDGTILYEDKAGYYCYMYNIDRKRWDLISVEKYVGLLSGSKGELYASMQNSEYILDESIVPNTGTAEQQYQVFGTPYGGIVPTQQTLDALFPEKNYSINDYTYITTFTDGFLDTATVVDGVVTYPYIYFYDETLETKYHKLQVKDAALDAESTTFNTTALLLPIQELNENSNYGWNPESDYTEGGYENAFVETFFYAVSIFEIENEKYDLYRLFSSEKLKQFVYISKNFSLSNQTVNKLLSKIKIVYNNTAPTFEYMINNDGKWIQPEIEKINYEDYCITYQIPKDYKKAKSIKLKIFSNSIKNVGHYDTEVDSYSIIYRERGNS